MVKTMIRHFDLGRINYNGTGKRYPVTVRCELELRGGEPTYNRVNGELVPTGETTPEYYEFTASASIGACCAGQCLDEINKHRMDFGPEQRALWNRIFTYWKQYHLNGMHAGTPEQEEAVKEWINAGNKYDYADACEMLKEKGLYEIPFTGKTIGKEYNGEMCRYGSAWVVTDIPAPVLDGMRELIGG